MKLLITSCYVTEHGKFRVLVSRHPSSWLDYIGLTFLSKPESVYCLTGKSGEWSWHKERPFPSDVIDLVEKYLETKYE